MVLEPTACHEAAQHVDHLVHALAAPFPRHVHRREVLGPRADADAEPQAVVAEHADARGLLGDEHDGPHRELQHEGGEQDASRARGEVGDEGEGLDDRLVLEEGAVAVGGVRVERVRLGREDQAVGHDERVVARVLGGLRERREERGVTEGLGVAESHGRDHARRAATRLASGAGSPEQRTPRRVPSPASTTITPLRPSRHAGRRCGPADRAVGGELAKHVVAGTDGHHDVAVRRARHR